jgi:phenylalanine-4-hydroxylase
MLTKELKDKLKETLAICGIHHQRMKFAYDSIKDYFPLTETNFGQISQLEMALFDQLVYRFSKLQDSMGTRLFKQLLEALEEDFSGLPFIDILNKMEKLNLLENAKDWIKLRQTRNNVAHEYPFYKEVQIEELNILPDEVLRLEQIWKKLEAYTQKILKDKTTEY